MLSLQGATLGLFSGEVWVRAGLQWRVIGRMSRFQMSLAARSEDLVTADPESRLVLCLHPGSLCLLRAGVLSSPISPGPAGFSSPEEADQGQDGEQWVPPPNVRPSGGTPRAPLLGASRSEG